MAPRKRVALSTTVRWSFFDIALLRYLHARTGKSINDVLRDASQFYAKHVNDFDAEDFTDFARDELLPEIESADQQNAFIQELNAFLLRGKKDKLPAFRSKASDFDFE